MFFILPFQHDRMSVRRLPWVSIAILALNVVIFLAVHPSAKRNNERVEVALNEVYDYWATHVFVRTTPAFEAVFPKPHSGLRKLIGKTWDPPPEQEMARRQAEFDALITKALATAEESPYYSWGYIPAKPSFIALLTCLFVHSGWIHLIGNMLFLYLAGPFIEDLWGRPLYTLFYLFGGAAATWAHALYYPDSTIPLVGASGAIAAVMGAFMIRMAKTKIQFLYVYFLLTVRWGFFYAPAWIMLPLWLLDQWWQAELAGASSGVAFWAHIGGFMFGAAAGIGMKVSGIEERFIRPAIDAEVSYGGDPRIDEGLELRELGETGDAMARFEAVLRDQPENLEARGLLFETALAQQEEDLAKKHAIPLLEGTLKASRRDLALRYFEGMKALDGPSLPPRLLFAVAAAYEKAREEGTARATYRRLAAEHPEDLLALKSSMREAELALGAGDAAAARVALGRVRAHPLAEADWQEKAAALETSAPPEGDPPPRTQAESPEPPPPRFPCR